MPTIEAETPTARAVETHTTPREASFQGRAVALIAGVHTLHDTYAGFLPPLLPLFIENLAISRAEAGLLDVFMRWPSVLQPFIGYLADRVSLRYVLIIAPAITTTLMSLIGIAPSYAILAALLMAVGLSSAAFHAVAPAIAGKLSGTLLGRGRSFWMMGGALGRALGPVVVVTAIRLVGLEGMPWLAILGIVSSLSLLILLRDVKDPPAVRGPTLRLGPAMRAMSRGMLPLGALVIARALLSASVNTFLPTFLTDEGADLWFAGVSLTALELAGLPGVLAGGYLSDRLGRRLVLFVSVLAAPLLVLLLLSVSGWAYVPVLLLLGFTMLSTTPVLMALVQESFPENRALANGLYMAASFVIRSGAIYLVGLGGDWVGLRTTLYLCAAVSLLALPFIPRLPQDRIRQA